ncbi:MAG: hypothetical protein C0451_09635 [Comamonadaceae bacterium]|nr:hypothetical protein [Comamonadaceae bacterium]
MAKKHKKHKSGQGQGMQGMSYGQGYGAQDASAWDAQAKSAHAMGADFQAGLAAALGNQGAMPGLNPSTAANGFMQQLPAFLRTRNTEQFLIGAVVGAAAAWVLSDEELRGKILKSAMKLYAGVAGGFEEMKEQMADLKAEAEAERHGEA